MKDEGRAINNIGNSLKSNVYTLAVVFFLYIAGFLIAYLPYLSQTQFPMGWDTRRYVLGLISIHVSGMASMILAAPFRFGYFVLEIAFESVFKLNPYSTEIYFPLVLAAGIPPLFFLTAKQAGGSALSAIFAGVLGLVWNGYTRLVRDLHSNLLYLDILLIVCCLIPLYFRATRWQPRVFLGTTIFLLILLNLANYPLAIIPIVAVFLVFAQSFLFGSKTSGIILQLKLQMQDSWPFLAPLLIYIPFLLLDLRFFSNIANGVWSLKTSPLTAPSDLSSLALIDPRSNVFLPVAGWIGYGNVLQWNWISLVSVILTFFFAIIGIIDLLRKGFGSRSRDKRAPSFFMWLSIIIIVSALFSSLFGIYLPPWRAINDLPLPLFAGLGIGLAVEAVAKKRQPMMIPRRLSLIVFVLVILSVSLTLLPYQIDYSFGGNTAGHFNQNNLSEVMEVKSWLLIHNSTKPWIIIDSIENSADYVQLNIEVAQTYFGDTQTFPYYGNLTYLLDWQPTLTLDPEKLEYSLYYFNILNQTLSDWNATVIVMNFLYPIANSSNLNVTWIGTDCYVFNL